MLYIFLLVLIGIIFHTWFTFLPISSGDLGFFFKEHIVEYLNPPFMWETFRNVGFGGDSFLHQGVYWYNLLIGILGRHFDYGVIERIIWFYPILFIGFLSPLFLGKVLKLFPSSFYPLMSLIFLLNTYFLMIMGGGQLTVVFGYITIPILLATFINLLRNFTISNILIFSLLFAFLLLFDFRFAYIFLLILFIYTIFLCLSLISKKELITLLKKYIVIFFVSLGVILGVHAYWLLPYLANYHSPTAAVGAAYTSVEAVKYFSFAQFENSLSLLHPYWPENIFGKVGFMKPEFLLLPILAYFSLFFIKKREKEGKYILFFVTLGLLGSFLGKGANPPFGEVYVWLFNHIPGFFMFRDSTKWYTLTAVSYSILIPFSLWKVYDWLKSQQKFQISNFKLQINSKNQIFNFQNLFLVFTLSYLLFLIHPAILGQLGGTLKPVTVPQEYVDYKDFLIRQDTFFRVLWVPTMQRFTFYSDTNPAIPGIYFFDTYDEHGVVKVLQKNNVKELLEQSGVKYVVVPDDTQKEIFLKDRKYDESQYKKTVEMLRKIPWLSEIRGFGKIVVFELDNPRDHFWTTSSTMQLRSKLINPTEYQVEVKNAKIGDKIIFAETYDGGWYMQNGTHGIYDTSYNKYFNSFALQKSGDYMTYVTYKPQSSVTFGLTITSITLLTTLGAMGVLLVKKKKKYD